MVNVMHTKCNDIRWIALTSASDYISENLIQHLHLGDLDYVESQPTVPACMETFG